MLKKNDITPVLSRRNMLKLAAGLVVGALTLPVVTSAHAAETAHKPLVVYFSRTGNTKTIAQKIQSATQGDLLELTTAHAYPDAYRALTGQAKREQESNFRPELTTSFPNMDAYDVVFVGYPNWWGTMPMAYFSFFEKFPCAGKKVVPFCTHEGSGLGRGPKDIAALCPQATLLEGLAIRGGDVAQSDQDVTRWLRRIGV